MRTEGLQRTLPVLAALLWLGTAAAAAQEAVSAEPEPAAPQVEPKSFTWRLDPLVIGAWNSHSDTRSSKFEEYRDVSSGIVTSFHLAGEGSGDRVFDLDAVAAGRDDARYTLSLGVPGKLGVTLDYNKIPHRFGNDGHLLFTRTAAGRYEIADTIQGALQAQTEANRTSLNFGFLNGLLAPYLAAARRVDVGLQRDRTLARVDLGKMGRLAWGLEYTHEDRKGTRPFGASFGFNNVTELPEPIDYDTSGAEVAGEWNGDKGGVRFGYRYSDFTNNVGTVIWDNPFRLTSSTDANAYQAPSSSSVNGSALGFADLAPDNKANLAFANGRGRFGRWNASGSASYNRMRQNDALLPYTLNSAIVGIDAKGLPFNPADPANLPARSAGREVEVTALNGLLDTSFGSGLGLSFHYRYYDYANGSKEIEFPGYVRFHSVWEPIARIAVPYSYSRRTYGSELGWDFARATRLALSFEREGWDRELREVSTTAENRWKLSFDTHPFAPLTLHASYELGDRSIGDYRTEAQEATFAEPEGITNLPDLRKFDEAARELSALNLLAQVTLGEAWSFSCGLNSRDEDYDESRFGLQRDKVLHYNAELSYAPGEALNLFVFGQRSDRDVRQRGRQSGSTPSTNPLDDWPLAFTELTDTWGLGLNAALGPKWGFDLSGNWSRSDGEADFTAFPGGLPLGTPPRTLLDLPNYEDIELLSVAGRLEYKLGPNVTTGIFYRYEDYTIDSFILQGLQNYLPGALILAADAGSYRASLIGLDLSLKF